MNLFQSFRVAWQLHKPLGWSQLTHRKFRLLVALLGVAFSNILIFTQLGLRDMLFEGVTLVPEHLKGDLFVLSSFSPKLDVGSFPKTFLFEAAEIEGVQSVGPLYLRSANWVNPVEVESGQTSQEPEAFELFPSQVLILAFNPTQPILDLPEVDNQLAELTQQGAVLFDRLGQDKLGPVPKLLDEKGYVSTLINNRPIIITGLFSLGSTLYDNGHLAMSDWNFAQWFGPERLEKVNVGVITLAENTSVKATRAALQNHLPKSVKVLTKEELITAEKAFHQSLPNGKVLNFGALMGFIIGIVIVYQVLYTDVNEHLPEYATLKAIGFSNGSLLMIVLQEALFLAVLGFIPGSISSYWVYQFLVATVKVPLELTMQTVIQVFVLTVVMCLFSGAITLNKLRSADPADVF
ncbi:MAG: ABC transporter permease DevC [Cyanobacteria bacterium P01_F01_bin.42]